MMKEILITLAVVTSYGLTLPVQGHEGRFALQSAEFELYRDLGRPPVEDVVRCIRLSNGTDQGGVEIVHLILRKDGSSLIVEDKIKAFSRTFSRTVNRLPKAYGAIIRNAPSVSSLMMLKEAIEESKPTFYSGYIEYAEWEENRWVRVECPVIELEGKLAEFKKVFGAFGGVEKLQHDGDSTPTGDPELVPDVGPSQRKGPGKSN